MYVSVEEMMYRILICGKKNNVCRLIKKMIQIDFMNIFEIFVCCMINFHTMYNVYKYEIF
jgi:hypothetical protein